MEIRKASPLELTQIYANVHEVWPHHQDPETHVQLRLTSVQHQYADWYIALVDQQIVASLGWYPFEFRLDNKILKGAGIGAVHTPQQHRRQGYAKKLLDGVHESMRQNGVDICHLYSDIDPKYYQKMGYLIAPTVHVSHIPGQHPGLDGLILREWDNPSWQNRQQLFEEFGPQHTFNRGKIHWEWLDRRYPGGRHLQIHNSQGQKLGYLSFSAPYRTHPAQLMDGTWPQACPYQQVFSLVEYGSWLLGMRDSFTAWYPQYFVNQYPKAKLAGQEIPMILPLSNKVPASVADRLWFFPAEHI